MEQLTVFAFYWSSHIIELFKFDSRGFINVDYKSPQHLLINYECFNRNLILHGENLWNISKMN